MSNASKKTNLISLFASFMKIGLFTFGGGYAMIALLENEFVSKRNWIKKDEFLDMVAIAESTPGPIAINAATYIGMKMAGFAGALVSTIGVCFPSFAIIYVISLFFDAFLSLEIVAKAFRGIQVAVIYLILSAGIKLFKGLEKKPFQMITLALSLALFVGLTIFNVKFSSIVFILVSGVLGISFFYLFKGDRREN